MRNCLKTIISISAVVSVLGLNSSVFGVAAFARQTGLDCTSCHSSAGFPTLNTFGAAFKAGGYVNGDDANMMGDGEALSIPKALNISVVTKLRHTYQITDKTGKSTGVGEFDAPDEMALLLGGRVGKNVGYLIEWGAGPLTARIPIVFDAGPTKLGVVGFATDAMGPQLVFETAATGAQRNLRAFENLNGVSRAYDKFTNDGVASGVGAYVYHSMFYAAVAGFTQNLNADEETKELTDAPAIYARVAVTPNVAGLDTLVGVQYWTGKTGAAGEVIDTSINGNDFKNIDLPAEYDRMIIDAQVQGTLGVPMLIFFNYGIVNKNQTVGWSYDSLLGTPVVANKASGKGYDMILGVDAQIIENKANLGLGYGRSDDGVSSTDAVQSVLVVGKYNVLRNLRLNLEYAKGLTKGAEESKFQTMLFGSW